MFHQSGTNLRLSEKGAIAVGMDADLVVYDPEMDFVITNDKMHSDCDHTIWEGCKLHGYPVQTYSRGRLVYETANSWAKPAGAIS